MFDRITSEELRSAPRLDNVNPDRLAADLADAYVQITVAKALLEQGAATVDSALLTKLTSIARAQESYALILDESPQRNAAAHVAARAYQMIALNGDSKGPTFTPGSIPTEVSSMLLFVVADATADAEEMAQYLKSEDDSLESAMMRALSLFGRSDFRTLAQVKLPPFDLPSSSAPHTIAAYVGYYECLRELLALARALLHVDRAEWVPGGFAAIADRMRGSFDVDIDANTALADDTVAGPWHLALLLAHAERVLVPSAVTAVRPPAGILEPDWTELVERLSSRRPTLWRNHRDAIGTGFLENGTSAVITFPTGAGKSTVTELKVAAVTLSGRNAIFLVPTLSLLDQQATALRSTLRDVEIVAQRDTEDLFDAAPQRNTRVFVLTPESCLALLSAAPERFGDVGLIAFDEAHLLSASGDIPSRRSIDATLCLLLLCSKFTQSDVILVSAMIANAEPLRDWLSNLTGRKAVALSDPWKPTRQARGAVVYRAQDLSALTRRIEYAANQTVTETPPAALRREVEAVPYGFFGLSTTWESTRSEDYRWLPLLNSPVPLGIAGKRSQSGWRLSSNQNRVSSAIAVAAAGAGKKVLVFTQQVTWAVSTSNQVNSTSQRRTILRTSEKALLLRAIEAMGSIDALYGQFDGDYVVGDSLPHHGLLLREERRLHETLYRRADGIPVLIATSTLAQGMNLPSEIVVIAGDRRFDADTVRMERLEAQELLNAAGRAGRAGMRSNGLVVVVPSYPVAYDGSQQMGPGWFELQQAFSQSDQCVTVSDPLTTLLSNESELAFAELTYLTRRLAYSDTEGDARALVLGGFGAYSAQTRADLDDIERRLEAVSLALDPALPNWVRSTVASTGLAPEQITFIGEAFEKGSRPLALREWIDWFSDVLRQQPGLLESVLRSGSRATFRGVPAELGSELESLNGRALVDTVLHFLNHWLSGATLWEIQVEAVRMGVARSNKKCDFARKFVLRVVPDLAYAYGLPWLLARSMGLQGDFAASELSFVSSAIEHGVTTRLQLDYLSATPASTRIGAHRDLPE